MKILIEGERYPIDNLEELFESNQFYASHGNEGIIKNVGYYHNLKNNQLVFMLPKVFMADNQNTVFGGSSMDLLFLTEESSVISEESLGWIKNLSVYFYKSLTRFKQKYPDSSLINYSPVFQLKGIQKTFQYSYIDILLSFINYFKKNKNQTLYKHIEAIQADPKKPKWEKTIRKTNPIIVGDTLIYSRLSTRNKRVNSDEQLIIYFFHPKLL